MTENEKVVQNPYLHKYGKNLTEEISQKKVFDPIVGRDQEIRKSIEILSQKYKNNLIYTGQPGVGKTALVEGIAQKIVTNQIPLTLKDKELWVIDLASLSSAEISDGGFEVRMKKLIDEIEKMNGKIIPFIDEFHTIMGAGSSKALDAANILKPALARGTLKMIGATTFKEYHANLEKDGAMTRRFQRVNIAEPSEKIAIDILRSRRRKLEIHHQITITDEAIKTAVELSTRYITTKYLPDKAIDILDRASATTRLSIDSMPKDLEELKGKIYELNLEKKQLKNDHKRLKEINDTIRELTPVFNKGVQKWQAEKSILERMTTERNHLETLRKEKILADSSQDTTKSTNIAIEIEKYEKILTQVKKKFKESNPSINDEVDSLVIMQTIEDITGIPTSKLSRDIIDTLNALQDNLHKRVIGQDDAIVRTAYAIKRSRLGMSDPTQPIGTFLFLGPSGTGKALTNDTLIPTPNGYKKMGNIKITDSVFDENGQPTMVLGVFPQGEKEVYKVHLADGRVVKSSKDHLWTYYEKGVQKTTKLESLLNKQLLDVTNDFYDFTFKLPMAKGVQYNMIFSDIKEEDVIDYATYLATQKITDDKFKNLCHKKLIDNIYYDNEQICNQIIFNSVAIRKLFIKTFMSAYHKNNPNDVTDNIVHYRNADFMKQFVEIIRSVGYYVAYNEKVNNGAFIELEDTIDSVGIASIEKTSILEEMTCIYVSNHSHLFLANNFVVTHNTELVKTLAETMFGDEDNMIRFDMGEFSDKRSIAKLVGAPPGDSGYEDGGELTEYVKNHPYCLILLDETDKAHPAVWDLMLSIFDDGRITDNRGEVVNFKNTIIIMTSNIGQYDILQDVNRNVPNGKSRDELETNSLSQHAIDDVMARLKNSNRDAGGKGFRPEFLNRLDAIVFFLPLTRKEDVKIANLKLRSLKKLLKRSRDMNIVFGVGVTETVRKNDPNYPKRDVARHIALQLTPEEMKLGARPINKYIQKLIEDKITDLFLEKNIPDGSNLYIYMDYPEGKDLFYIANDGYKRAIEPEIQIKVINDDLYNALLPFDPTLPKED